MTKIECNQYLCIIVDEIVAKISSKCFTFARKSQYIFDIIIIINILAIIIIIIVIFEITMAAVPIAATAVKECQQNLKLET